MNIIIVLPSSRSIASSSEKRVSEEEQSMDRRREAEQEYNADLWDPSITVPFSHPRTISSSQERRIFTPDPRRVSLRRTGQLTVIRETYFARLREEITPLQLSAEEMLRCACRWPEKTMKKKLERGARPRCAKRETEERRLRGRRIVGPTERGWRRVVDTRSRVLVREDLGWDGSGGSQETDGPMIRSSGQSLARWTSVRRYVVDLFLVQSSSSLSPPVVDVLQLLPPCVVSPIISPGANIEEERARRGGCLEPRIFASRQRTGAEVRTRRVRGSVS